MRNIILKLTADALAMYAEERRVYEHDIIDEPSDRHYQSVVSEWDNPGRSNTTDLSNLLDRREPGELKHLSNRRKRNQ